MMMLNSNTNPTSDAVSQITRISWRQVGLIGTLVLILSYLAARWSVILTGAARARRLFMRKSDRVILHNIRSAIDPILLNPSSVSVYVNQGIALLKGHLRDDDKELVMRAVRNVDGVLDVVDDLKSVESVGKRPSFNPSF